MRALVLKGRGRIEYMEKPTPVLLDDYGAILKPIVVSPCTSDVHTIWQGSPKRQDLTLGHECIARVLETGASVHDFKAGDIVAVPAITPDWGHPDVDTNPYHAGSNFSAHMLGKSIDGAFQEYFFIPYADKNLALVPHNMPLEAALMCTDIFATGLTAVLDSAVTASDIVAVFGIGGIGLSVVALSYAFGAQKVFAVGSREISISVAKAWGAEIINYKTCSCALPEGMHPMANSTGSPVVNYLLQATQTKGVDKAIICGGNDDALSQAVDVVKYGNGIVENINYYGTTERNNNAFIKLPKFSIGRGMSGKTLKFSLSRGGRKHLEKVLDICNNSYFHPEQLVTKTYNGINNIMEAIHDMKNHKVIKVAVFL